MFVLTEADKHRGRGGGGGWESRPPPWEMGTPQSCLHSPSFLESGAGRWIGSRYFNHRTIGWRMNNSFKPRKARRMVGRKRDVSGTTQVLCTGRVTSLLAGSPWAEAQTRERGQSRARGTAALSSLCAHADVRTLLSQRQRIRQILTVTVRIAPRQDS